MSALLLLLAAATMPQAASALPRASGDPVALFSEACLGAGARLTRGISVSTSYGALPPGGRAALGQAQFHAAGAPVAAPSDGDVPNQMFRIGGGDTYLIVPTSVPVPEAAYADACAVVWKGGDFAAAYKAALPGSPALAPASLPAANKAAAAYASGSNKGRDVVVAALGGWIVLKSTPTPQPLAVDQ